MQKIIRKIFTAASLIICICLSMSVTIMAEDENVINELTVTSVPEMIEVGKSVSEYADKIVIPESEKYETAIVWSEYDTEGNANALAEDAVFAKGKEYVLTVSYRAKEGYTLPESEFDITVNGAEYDWCEMHKEGEYAESPIFEIEYYYSLREVILEVELENVPEAAVGEIAAIDAITVPEGANYELSDTLSGWLDYMEGMGVCNGEAFEEGHKYLLCLSILPKEGYCFSEETVLKINGEVQVDNYFSFEDSVEWEKEYAFTKALKDVSIDLDMDIPEVGKKVKDIKLKISKNKNYKLSEVKWYNSYEFEEMEKDAFFEVGEDYSAEITILPKEGYVFDDTATLNLNGEKYEDFTVNEDGSIVVFAYHSMYGDIETVAIDNVVEATAGEKANLKSISIPKDAEYEIDWEYTYWMDSTTFEYLEDGDVFQDGKEYMLSIAVKAKEGKAFAKSVKVSINGEETIDFIASPSSVSLMKFYTFLEKIEKLEILENIPAAIPGEQAQENFLLKVSDDAQYEVSGSWAVYNSENGLESFTGVFEEGKAYIFGLSAMAKEGYTFADDIKVYAKGEKKDTIHVVHLGSMYVSMYVRDLGENTIHTVEISVKKPEAGNEIKIENLIIPEDAGYVIEDIMWVNPITYEELTGVFEENGKYELSFALASKENYVFADDLTFIINGETYSYDQLSGMKLFTPVVGAGGIIYELTPEKNEESEQKPVEKPEEQKPEEKPIEKPIEDENVEKAPQTGDTSMNSMWILLLLMSGFMLYGNRRKVK